MFGEGDGLGDGDGGTLIMTRPGLGDGDGVCANTNDDAITIMITEAKRETIDRVGCLPIVALAVIIIRMCEGEQKF